MIELSPAQRRALRAQAHHLNPVVSVGLAGLTPRVMHEIDLALKAHGLIKVRVHSDDRGERESMLARIANALDSASVQHLGKLLILWRPLEEAEEIAAKPAKPAKRPAKKAPTPRRRSERKLQPVGRRARGASTADRESAGKFDATARPRRNRDASNATAPRASFGKSAPNPRRRRRAP